MKKEKNPKHQQKISEFHLGSLPHKGINHLFDSLSDEAYIQKWTASLKDPTLPDYARNTLSVLVFRLGKEWLALPTVCFKEVTQRRPVHRIPHRSGKILQGLVNLNGNLELYIHLHALLQIETLSVSDLNRIPYQLNRMMAIIKDGELWVFPVDEIEGIHNWNLSAIEDASATISKSILNYIRGVMHMDDKMIKLLDEELLFSSLKRSI